MPNPVLLAVDDDRDALESRSRELRERYSRDYRVCASPRPRRAGALEKLADAGARSRSSSPASGWRA